MYNLSVAIHSLYALTLFLILSTPVEANSLFCQKSLEDLPSPLPKGDIQELCNTAQVRSGCSSEQDAPIFHFQSGSKTQVGKNILVFSMVHGDEPASASVAVLWARRLLQLKNSRNSWRIIPILNPDGWKKSTRTNSKGVDINRNFPTQDWDYAAQGYWEKVEKKNPRRYPGKEFASEKETRCAVDHIKDFAPDMIIAIHTPYGLLDFDGPQLNFPAYKGLPWQQLGHFPGSLGRYMWYDNQVPVLTIELKSEADLKSSEKLFELQDLTGLVAIQSLEFLKKSVFKRERNKN